MKTFTIKTIQVQETDAVYCNKCGSQCDHETEKDYASLEVHWGFWSRKDMQKHAWDICEDCYDQFVATFTLPPSRYEYSISTGEILGELEDK